MKKRTVFIGAILSLISIGQPLLIKTGVVLSTAGLVLFPPQKVYAQTAEFYFHSANDKEKNGDHYGAISDYTKSIEINPSEGAYYNRGISKRNLNDYYGAISDYTKAIEINPKKDSAYYNRGNAKTALKDHYGAISDYTKAIEISPRKDAFYNRGNRKMNLKDYYGAISDYIKAIELDPKYIKAYINRSIAKEIIGDINSACSDAKKAFSLGHTASDNQTWIKKNC